MIVIYPKLMQYTTTKVNPKVNYGDFSDYGVLM